jgi:uncharacterized protein YaaQ
MQLLLAIVQDQDAGELSDRLVAAGFHLTRINTVGGFLHAGNVTVLMGLEASRVPEARAIIGTTCRTRTSLISAAPFAGVEGGAVMAVTPIEVQIGGATVFTFPIRRMSHVPGGASAPDPHEESPSEATPRGGNPMQLVLSIVHPDAADDVSDGLVTAGYRVTRISTAGGFLRRTNATLLIGVEQDKVDDVMRIIRDNCRPRTDPARQASGTPTYGATVFVLDASGYWHL